MIVVDIYLIKLRNNSIVNNYNYIYIHIYIYIYIYIYIEKQELHMVMHKAQWDNQKLVSEMSWFRLQSVLVYLLFI